MEAHEMMCHQVLARGSDPHRFIPIKAMVTLGDTSLVSTYIYVCCVVSSLFRARVVTHLTSRIVPICHHPSWRPGRPGRACNYQAIQTAKHIGSTTRCAPVTHCESDLSAPLS